MANDDQDTSSSGKELQIAGDEKLLKYLGGTGGLTGNDGKDCHFGVSIQIKSAEGTESSLVISDVKKKASLEAPVFITKAVKLELNDLKEFLNKQGADLDKVEPLKNLLATTEITCDAFYYTGETGPLLMMFGLNFDASEEHGGLIESLSGSKELGKLFDIKGVSLRVFRCNNKNLKRLRDYCETLPE